MIMSIVYLWCDRCHAAGPEAVDLEQLIRTAHAKRWVTSPPAATHPHTVPALCPMCAPMMATV